MFVPDIYQYTAIRLRVVLNPRLRLSEPPIRRFFRVVTPKLHFAPNGTYVPATPPLFAPCPTHALTR